jgi:hypothetical protein
VFLLGGWTAFERAQTKSSQPGIYRWIWNGMRALVKYSNTFRSPIAKGIIPSWRELSQVEGNYPKLKGIIPSWRELSQALTLSTYYHDTTAIFYYYFKEYTPKYFFSSRKKLLLVVNNKLHCGKIHISRMLLLVVSRLPERISGKIIGWMNRSTSQHL